MSKPNQTSQYKRDRAISRATIKLFFEALRVDKWTFYLSFLSIPVVFINSIIAPYLIAVIIGQMVAHQYDLAGRTIWILAGLSAANIGLSFFWNTMFDINGVKAAKYLHQKVFNHMINQDYDFFSNHYTGSLASYQQRLLNAFLDYDNLVYDAIPKVVVVIVGTVIVLIIKAPFLGLITLLCVILITVVTIIAAIMRLHQRRELSYQNGRLAGQLSDSLSHAATVKSFAKEKRETKRLLQYVEDWAKSQYAIWQSYIYTDAIRTFFHSLMFVVILFVSLKLFSDGKISVAIVALVQLYTVRLLATTLDIAQVIKRNEADMSDAYQMMLILQRQAEVADPQHPKSIGKPNAVKVTFEDISFHYGDDSLQGNVIKNVSLSIKPGEKVGLVGPSGGGKTTLSKLILRFHDVTAGSIKLNGFDVRDLRQEELRNLVAYVPQEPLLFFRSIGDNIGYALDHPTDKIIEQAAQQAHITEFASQFSDGLDTLVGERGVKLSGGQRQRVAIARAMLCNAPILVLDEATSALDSATEHLIQDALWKLMKSKTAVVIAHRLSTIQKMDRIVVLDKGQIIEQGSHAELLKNNGLYAKLWEHQSGGFIGEM